MLRSVDWYDVTDFSNDCIAFAERDGTRAETRIRLSPKRTSPFKSVGASVQSTTGSREVRISSSNGSNAGQTTFRGKVELYWLPTPFACFPFTPPHRASPCATRFRTSSTWSLANVSIVSLQCGLTRVWQHEAAQYGYAEFPSKFLSPLCISH